MGIPAATHVARHVREQQEMINRMPNRPFGELAVRRQLDRRRVQLDQLLEIRPQRNMPHGVRFVLTTVTFFLSDRSALTLHAVATRLPFPRDCGWPSHARPSWTPGKATQAKWARSRAQGRSNCLRALSTPLSNTWPAPLVTAFGETMSLFRAVAWDIDGTLIDSEPLHQRALLAASAALGADLNDLENDAFRGVHAPDIWKALRPRFSADATFETWITGIESYYVAHAAELEPIPGAIDAMRELAARGVAQACVSNSGRTIVDANINTLGIGKIIAFSLSLDDVVSGKPDPEPFRAAA